MVLVLELTHGCPFPHSFLIVQSLTLTLLSKKRGHGALDMVLG